MMCVRLVLIGCLFVAVLVDYTPSTAATFLGLGEDANPIRVSANGQWIVGSRTLPPEQQPVCPPNADCALATAPFTWGLSTGSRFIENAGFQVGLAISDHGNVVTGNRREFHLSDRGPFLWAESQGLVDLGGLPGVDDFGYGTDVSADGTVVVGGIGEGFFATSYGYHPQAFRWTASAGMQGLGDLEGGDFRSFATAVSPDGSVVVGEATSFGNVGGQAFRWTEETGMIGLGFVDDRIQSTANDVSSDGSAVVGYGYGLLADPRAFRWTAETGMQNLGFEVAKAVTGDGRTVVGTDEGQSVAVIWDAEHGLRDLRDYLINEHGLAAELAEWQLTSSQDISSDGRTIVGFGVNPAGDREPWVFTTREEGPLDGDYNRDGFVDASDYTLWRKNDGTQEGYDRWRAHFGQIAGNGNGSSASAAVPEPATGVFLLLFTMALSHRRACRSHDRETS